MPATAYFSTLYQECDRLHLISHLGRVLAAAFQGDFVHVGAGSTICDVSSGHSVADTPGHTLPQYKRPLATSVPGVVGA
eukprot:3293718-Rhodomonas_salina.2